MIIVIFRIQTLVIEAEFLTQIRAELPELPDEKKHRLMKQYGLSAYDAGVLTSSRELANYFEETVTAAESDLCQLGHGGIGGVVKQT